MKILIAFVALLALALVIVPPVMYLGDIIDKSPMQTLMLAGTVLWFVAAPFWMKKAGE